MDSQLQKILLGVSILFLQSSFGQKFEFIKGSTDEIIQYDHLCGLEHLVGNWSLQGVLYMGEYGFYKYHTKIVIWDQEHEEEICNINLMSCSPFNLPESTDACFCSGSRSNKFNFTVRRRPRITYSGASVKLQAMLISRSPKALPNFVEDVATLPPVYRHSCRAFDFHDPVQYNTDCWMVHLKDTWTVTGYLHLHKRLREDYQHIVYIQIEDGQNLCRIDLRVCPPTHLPTHQDACYCTHRESHAEGDQYTFFVRRRPRVNESLAILEASLYPPPETRNRPGSPKPIKATVGMLPPVLDVPIASFSVDNSDEKILAPVQNITVKTKKFATIKFCVQNLSDGHTVKILVGDTLTRSIDACVFMSRKYDFSQQPMYEVKLSYTERDNCPRTGNFIIHILEDRDKDIKVRSKECISGDSNLPAVLPYGTCAHSEFSCKRELVTLTNEAKLVCDTETEGGNWVVIQRRKSPGDFRRDWAAYEEGFGNTTGNFWLGLKHIRKLCNKKWCELRIDMEYNGDKSFAHYWNFHLGGPQQNYKLCLSGYRTGSTAPDFFMVHNKAPFSTFDNDNDYWAQDSCANRYSGGWWFTKCHVVNLNGLWGSTLHATGINWYPITGYGASLTFTEMKIRPSKRSQGIKNC